MPDLGDLRFAVIRFGVVVATAILGSLAVVVGLGSRRASVRVAHLWGRCCLRLAGVPVTVEGRERIAAGGRYVIMANHESGLDIPALLAALPPSIELRFLAKRSLFRVPFLGWSMRVMGFIPVDREDRSTAAETLAQTLAQVRQGGSPLVFPEETFTADGRLRPFSRGGFLVALKSGLPVLPVGLEGPRLVLPPDGRSLSPRPITVRIGEPIPTAGLGVSRRRALTAEVRSAIDLLRGPSGHVADPPGDGAAGERDPRAGVR
ncbi:MAG: 1-acyl-sn-glycerol-3-phosphate acyltransferase [Thermoanaerobaculales bacterium]|nr:1-acyl-sn-glycerol-3-phosphate acyltransferase [Thermoanaerobaculales bacterium]